MPEMFSKYEYCWQLQPICAMPKISGHYAYYLISWIACNVCVLLTWTNSTHCNVNTINTPLFGVESCACCPCFTSLTGCRACWMIPCLFTLMVIFPCGYLRLMLIFLYHCTVEAGSNEVPRTFKIAWLYPACVITEAPNMTTSRHTTS